MLMSSIDLFLKFENKDPMHSGMGSWFDIEVEYLG